MPPYLYFFVPNKDLSTLVELSVGEKMRPDYKTSRNKIVKKFVLSTTTVYSYIIVFLHPIVKDNFKYYFLSFASLAGFAITTRLESAVSFSSGLILIASLSPRLMATTFISYFLRK